MSGRIRYENGVAVLSLTQKCNNFCVMCYDPRIFKDDASFEDLKKDIQKLKNISEIYLTGGEPTIKSDIIKIILFIKKTYPKIKINLITNGRMMCYPSFVKKISRCDLNKVVTEIHASCEDLHDKITQVNNSFNQTVTGIKNMVKQNIKVELRIVINKINNDNLPGLAKFIVDNFDKFERIIIFPINIIGYAHTNKDKVVATFSQMKRNTEKAVDVLKDKFDVKLFHYPFCVIDKAYWNFVEGITTDINRISFAPQCKVCIKKKKCPRIWKTYIHTFGTKEFIPIKK